MPEREQNSNKGTFGKVLNIAGSANYIGAAYLSSLSVLKIGAGMVVLASERKVIDSVSKLLPEAVYLSRTEGLKSINNYNVVLIGCGLGKGLKSIYYFKKYIKRLRRYDIHVVIDADGLNILSNTNNFQLPDKVIITPHPAEAARLLRTEVSYVLNNLEQAAKELSYKYNCVVVLKTHRTVICYKDDVYINEHGNSALAKAGTGDVLAGIISGLLAQGMTLLEAAKLGVYLHSRAGEISSQDLTEYSVLASDLVNYFPAAIKEISQQP